MGWELIPKKNISLLIKDLIVRDSLIFRGSGKQFWRCWVFSLISLITYSWNKTGKILLIISHFVPLHLSLCFYSIMLKWKLLVHLPKGMYCWSNMFINITIRTCFVSFVLVLQTTWVQWFNFYLKIHLQTKSKGCMSHRMLTLPHGSVTRINWRAA